MLHQQYFYATLLLIIFFLSYLEGKKKKPSFNLFFLPQCFIYIWNECMCCGVGVSEGKEAQFLWKGNSAFHAIFFSVPSHSCACSSPGLNAVSSPNSYSIYSLCLRIWHLIIVRSPAVLCGLVLSTQIESKLSAGMGHILYSITPGWTNSSSQNSNTSWWIFISVIKGSIQQEDITLVNMHVPNIGWST